MKELINIGDYAITGEQVDCKLTHTFSNGIYMRQVEIPKNSLIEGKRHREETINILLKGKMSIIDGDTRIVLEAPCIFTSDKFTKKIGYAHEDSIWVNVHHTFSTDLEQIEKQFIIEEDEYKQLTYEESKCLGLQ